MKQWRGKELAMILQDPLTSLNPVYSIGSQVGEVFRLENRRMNTATMKRKVVDVLESVNIPSARRRLNDYPFQFSGGMRQRVSAAMNIARSPKLLIADEPTTALDVTVQYQFLGLLKKMQEENHMGLILVTHDLGVVAETCDSIAVMYAGKIVEQGTVANVYRRPAHPYTQALLRSIPTLGQKRDRLYQTSGEPPNLLALPKGCRFHLRCDRAMDICRHAAPPETTVDGGGRASCWLLKKRDAD
jgi:oligopeptide/dipeptide ABC transporter ATP-binding protein